jgi:hypothetical protein
MLWLSLNCSLPSVDTVVGMFSITQKDVPHPEVPCKVEYKFKLPFDEEDEGMNFYFVVILSISISNVFYYYFSVFWELCDLFHSCTCYFLRLGFEKPEYGRIYLELLVREITSRSGAWLADLLELKLSRELER